MTTHDLDSTARALVAPGKGILAADESAGTIKKRFDGIKLEATEENGRRYREMLFTTAGAAEHISGVILFDATIRQATAGGQRFVDLLTSQGIIPGIKVDAGVMDLPGCPGEKISAGADGLRKRLAQYRELGARFAKWRAVIDIAPGIPSALCLRANAEALAHYAACCQAEGIVPIVEPEVLMDGDHGLARCEDVTTETLHQVFDALYAYKVRLEGMLLKPNMVIAGAKCVHQDAADVIAEATLRCFRRTVPAAVPGIVFLSGGQADVTATANLDAINRRGPHPWPISFSYGRALQAASIATWAGQDANIAAGQAAYLHRAKMNGLAARGAWTQGAEG
ncbi:MAG: fructose-bisphosphate aldolase class I [Myxococcales bacterium]|nr:fructose-bisphosphate aldolase class I [Myxococcales bacterium]